ncbi:hypothetical protein QTP70_027653, partial [Hemibagrus guttatus]
MNLTPLSDNLEAWKLLPAIRPEHQTFLRFAFRVEVYQFPVLAFGLALSPRTFTKCMLLNCVSRASMYSITGPLQSHGRQTPGCGAYAYEVARPQDQPREVCAFSISENHLPGSDLGFHHDAGMSISCSDGFHTVGSKCRLPRPEPLCRQGAESSWPHGGCSQCDSFVPASHEVVPVLAQRCGLPSPQASSRCHQGYVLLASYPTYVDKTLVSVLGSQSRGVSPSQDSFDGCLTFGLGCGLGWPPRPGSLERPSTLVAHKFPGHECCVSSTETLPPMPHVLVCTNITAVVAYLNHQGGLWALKSEMRWPGDVEALGLAPEGDQFLEAGLSSEVVETLGSCTLLSGGFLVSGVLSASRIQCPIGTVLGFLQSHLSWGLSPSTLKVYVAAIAANHALVLGATLGISLSVRCQAAEAFLQTMLPLLGPLGGPGQMGRGSAGSVICPACLEFAPGTSKIILHPRAGYVPKVPRMAGRPVILQAFCLPPHESQWVVEVITQAYETHGIASPLGGRVHSTRGVASSSALARGVPLQEICAAASRSS